MGARGVIRSAKPRPRREPDRSSFKFQDATAGDLRASEERKMLPSAKDLHNNEDDVFSPNQKLSPTGKVRATLS